MKIEHILPADIERRSMEIIEEELGEICLPPMEKDVIKRVIHIQRCRRGAGIGCFAARLYYRD